MAILLIHASGSLKNSTSRLTPDVVRLGRARDNEVVFSDVVVSSHHAEIRRSPKGYSLVDLESTNGTFLNGKRIRKSPLQDRDKIALGEKGPVFEFRLTFTEGSARPQIIPVSGAWENRGGPIELDRGAVTLGRRLDNDIVVGRTADSVVSALHAEIRVHSDSCEIADLESSNGTFLNGEPIVVARLRDRDRVELGQGGPVFEFRWQRNIPPSGHERSGESKEVLQRLKRAERGETAGDRTLFYLNVAKEYYKTRRRRLLLGSVAILALLGVFAAYQTWKLAQMTRQAEDLFYRLRSLRAASVQSVRARIQEKAGSFSPEESKGAAMERDALERGYDNYLGSLGLYKGKSPEQKAVMRLARQLGETDLYVPSRFHEAVMYYVDQWKQPKHLSRFRDGLLRAKGRNLIPRIRKALDQYLLPKEFLFLALQESGFEYTAVGPPTSNGIIAKGMWQFIPETARRYHLSVGPYQDKAVYDPSDQRHDENRSTYAAAWYLADIYATKAAASGLLVIAAYNRGENAIIRRLETLNNDPRQCNFWKFYQTEGWLPEETRNYVMWIFSAALICENPDIFGFSDPVFKVW